jgi:hypothetical protein
MWISDFHLAGHIARPNYMFVATMENVNPTHVEGLEIFLAYFYSFASMRALVLDFKDPAMVALQVWKDAVNKKAEISLHEGCTDKRKVWTEAAKLKGINGDKDLEWYRLRFLIESDDRRRVLWYPVRFLYALRVAEPASERCFSVAGYISRGRENLTPKNHASLTHIYWHHHCQGTRPKRRLEESDSDIESDTDRTSVEDFEATRDFAQLAEAAVEEVLEEIADGVPGVSKFHELAMGQVPQILQIAKAICVEDESPLIGRLRALPALEMLKEKVVTQKSLQKLVSVCKILKRYTQHDDSQVQLAARELVSGWRAIYKQTDSPWSTAALALNST